MFMSMRNSGFHIVFDNEYTISCQFSPMHHCSNFNPLEDPFIAMKKGYYTSNDCELAILDYKSDFVTDRVLAKLNYTEPDGSEVKGYVTADELADIINYVSLLPKEDK